MLTAMTAPSYCRLPSEEWERLRGIYETQGGRFETPGFSTAIVAEAEGRIVGMDAVNLIVHAGPIWVDPEWRRQGIALAMAKEVDALVKSYGEKGYYTFPSNPQSEGVMKKLGLELMDWKVYRREF